MSSRSDDAKEIGACRRSRQQQGDCYHGSHQVRWLVADTDRSLMLLRDRLRRVECSYASYPEIGSLGRVASSSLYSFSTITTRTARCASVAGGGASWTCTRARQMATALDVRIPCGAEARAREGKLQPSLSDGTFFGCTNTATEG